MISAYAEAIAGRLSFDRALSARVRKEVEDHLYQAVAEGGDAQQAIARFGEPRAIAAQFAAASLSIRLKNTGITVALALAAAFLAMKLRIEWYELTEWGLCEKVAPLAELVGSIDRSAFGIAALLAAAGWARPGRRLLFCSLAAACFLLSVASDGVLTFLRLADWDFSADFLVPLGSMAVEAACAAILLLQIRIAQRISAAAALL